MIFRESLVLTVTAGIIGFILGIISTQLLFVLNIFGGMSSVYTINIFVQAFGVAIIVGLIGG